MLRFLPLIFVSLFVVLLGYGVYTQTRPEGIGVSPMVGKALPTYSLVGYGAEKEVNQHTLAGQWRLINIFGSWCMACLIEHPELLALKEGKTIKIIGINWRDTAENLSRWLKRYGNPYDVIGLDPEGKAIIELGVSGAPESFLVDPEGVIRLHYQGPLTPELIKEEILPYLD